MFWSSHGRLKFKVHIKPNQALKYLNRGSSHTNSCFKAIASGVFGRLTKLTSKSKKTMNSRINELYPLHAAALKLADLAPELFPKMKEIVARLEINEKEKDKENVAKRRKVSRQVYFCVGICDTWKGKNAIHSTIKKLQMKHNLPWLRLSMSYHKFPNLREILQGDLNGKILKGIGSRDFEPLPCNCSAPSKHNGICIFNGKCRHSIVVYKATCRICKAFYIGNTQTHLKQRMNLHFHDVKAQVLKNIKSDTFAKHFASHFEKGTKLNNKEVRNTMTIDTLWEGNPISCTKSFGKLSCTLCMKERLHILKALGDKEETRLINSNNELYGACRHKPKFHRYTCYNPSTDDGQLSPERVIIDSEEIPHINSTETPNQGPVLCRRVSNPPRGQPTPQRNFPPLQDINATYVEEI